MTQPCRKFLLTYGSCSGGITHEMLSGFEKIEVDECYTLKQRDINYTLIHSTKRATRIAVTNVLIDLNELYGIKRTCVFGFETVSMGNEIYDHPGFKLMVENMNDKSPHFDSWMKPELGSGRRRGLLSNFLLASVPYEAMTRGQLVYRVKTLDKRPNYGSLSGNVPDDIGEFDVVKKRRLMTADKGDGGVDDDGDNETCPDAKTRFEEFEANVLPALVEISKDYQKCKNDEILDMEMDLCNNVSPQKGTFYVAVSRSLQFPKLGATRKSDPSQRLLQLSRSVPSAFEAAFTISTFTPFKIEAEIHRHFDAFRVREGRGACREFFKVDLETIKEHLKSNYPEMKEGSAADWVLNLPSHAH